MRISLTLASGILLAAASLSAQTWQLVWSDEFNGAANTQPDATKWTYDIGNNGWGNNELENYTDLAENAHMDGLGHLDIHVENPSPGVYTSARIKTEGLFATEYGRIEARIKLPFGQGIWPAFWMLGTDITTVSWPQCGEIDIMENIGSTPSTNYGSMHGPGYSGAQDLTGSYSLSDGGTLSDGFHVYAVEWAPEVVRFYFDGVSYETRTPADVPDGDVWVYDHPFFVILNVAVGGYWPGNPDSTTQFPQTMLVDYVRVYAQSEDGG